MRPQADVVEFVYECMSVTGEAMILIMISLNYFNAAQIPGSAMLICMASVVLGNLGAQVVLVCYCTCDRFGLFTLMLHDSCKKSFSDGSCSSPSPLTRSLWRTQLSIVMALRQSSSITSGGSFLEHNSSPCHQRVHGCHTRTSPQGPEVAPFLVLRYAIPCRLDSPQVSRNSRGIIALS